MGNGTSDKLLSFLKTNELFSELDDDELRSLLPFVKQQTYKKDDWIIREGETGENLFIIQMGRAEIVKEEAEHKNFQLLGLLEPGDWVGEMAHFEKERRSASIRAIEEVKVIILPLDELASQSTIYPKIIQQLTLRISQRLRKSDESLVESFREKIRLKQSHNHLGRTIIHLFILVTIYYELSRLFTTYLGEHRYVTLYFTPVILFVAAISVIWIILSSGYPLSYYGLSIKHWQKDLVEAALFTIPLLIGTFILAVALTRYAPILEGIPLFSPQNDKHLFTWWGAYILLVPLQELIVRGFLQGSLRDFFLGPHRIFFAILGSNLIFELFHTTRGIAFAIFLFTLGIFWGYLYERQKTIIGVSVSHLMVAIWCFIILNFDAILRTLS